MEKKGELIVVIINKGYSDLAIEAARKAGARGGTILNARGTGNKNMEELFGVAIQPEKEIILIVVDKSIKEDCLNSIYEACGLDTKGHGIAFAMEVDNMIGFDTVLKKEEIEQEEQKQDIK